MLQWLVVFDDVSGSLTARNMLFRAPGLIVQGIWRQTGWQQQVMAMPQFARQCVLGCTAVPGWNS